MGSILLLIGVIGGFIPVLQGWIFILAGLTLMAPESRRARRALDWAKRRVKRASGDGPDDSDATESSTDAANRATGSIKEQSAKVSSDGNE
jgi:hypothetical protein